MPSLAATERHIIPIRERRTHGPLGPSSFLPIPHFTDPCHIFVEGPLWERGALFQPEPHPEKPSSPRAIITPAGAGSTCC